MIPANTPILTTITVHLFTKALKMLRGKKYVLFCEELTLKSLLDVRLVNLFRVIKKINKTALSIKIGNCYTNLDG